MAVINAVLSDVSFWIGLGSVALFAYSRFNISLPDTDELSPPLAPRTFTTGFRFQLAAYVYVGVYTVVYFLLLIAASIPGLQGPLTTLFGTVQGASIGGSIGTPAGGALVATSILPSMPGFKAFDAWARGRLQAFASIPVKAWIIGQEMLEALGQAPEAALAGEPTSDRVRGVATSHKQVFDRLRSLWDELQQTEQSGPAQRYRKFFGDYKNVVDKLVENFSIKPDDLQTPESALYVERRLRKALSRAGRFTGCALLNAEPTEYAVRARLIEMRVDVADGVFNFGPAHIVVALGMIAVLTVLGVCLGVWTYALANHTVAADILRDHLGAFLSWGILCDFMYTLPLVLAAGIEMYLLDHAARGAPPQVIDRAAAALLNFVGAAGLAFVCMLAWSYLKLKLGPPPADPAQLAPLFGPAPAQSVVDPLRILPWVLAPATVSTIFLLMAGRATVPGWGSAAADGLVHGLGAAGASLVSLQLFELAGYSFKGYAPGLMTYVAPSLAGLIGFGV
ncbi:MAG TPA: hypothetical protein VF502_18950, partial [Stellaceae bacterium]